MAYVVYTCSVCGQTFNDDRYLSDHMMTNHTTREDVAEEGDAK